MNWAATISASANQRRRSWPPTVACATLSALISLLPPIIEFCHDSRAQRLLRYTYSTMTTPAADTPTRPIHRVAKELVASSGFLLARLGFGFKAKAIATLEQAGFELYDYSVLAILAEGVRETQATIADALDARSRAGWSPCSTRSRSAA